MLLSTLVAIDPFDSRLKMFDLDQIEPQVPSLIVFQIHVAIKNLVIHRCIIDEGALMYSRSLVNINLNNPL